MTTISPSGRHIFDAPAIYQIQVEGRLDTAWSPLLEGMAIRVQRTEAGLNVSTLVGELVDQAALSGVLIRLYDMQLTVLTVQRM